MPSLLESNFFSAVVKTHTSLIIPRYDRYIFFFPFALQFILMHVHIGSALFFMCFNEPISKTEERTGQ